MPIQNPVSFIGQKILSGTSGSILFVDSSGALGQSNSDFFRSNSTGQVGLGTSSPSAKLHVGGAADEVKLRVQGASAQTSDVISIYNGGGTRRAFAVTNNAADQSVFEFFPDSMTVTANQFLVRFNTDVTWSTNASFTPFAFSPELIVTTNQSLASVIHSPFGTSTTLKNDGIYSGHLGDLTALGGGGVVIADTTSCSTQNVISFGGSFTLQALNGGTLSVTDYIGLSTAITVLAGCTLTNYIGILVSAPSIILGTVTNKIGISLPEFTGSNNYSIQSPGLTTKARHAGDFWMPRDGAADLTERLHVQGRVGARNVLRLEATDTGQTADIFRIDSAAGTQILGFDDLGILTLSQYPAGWVKSNSSGVLAPVLGTANQLAGINGTGTDIEFKSINGTSNQITVTHGANSITLSTPQNIATGSSPTFAGLTLSGMTAGSVIFAGTSGVLSQDNSNFFWDDTNNRLGIGVNSSLTAKLQTTIGSATEIGLLLRAAASQSANVVELENSSSNNMTIFDSRGLLGMLQTASTISATAELVSVPAVTHTVSAAVGVSGYRSQATLNFSVTSGLANNFFFDNTAYKNDPGLVGGTLGSIRSFAAGNTFTADTNTWSISNIQGFLDNKTLSRTNSGTLSVTNIFHYRAGLTINTGTTLDNRIGFQVLAATVSGTFTTDHIAFDCADLSGGSNIVALRSQMTSGSGKWAIMSEGSAASAHVGLFRFGDTAAPTAMIDLAGAQANHIRMAGSTSDPATPTVGDIWYHTTRKNHSVNTTAGTGGITSLINVATTSSTAIASTASETAYSGGFTFPANSLTVGTVIDGEWSGLYSNTGTPTLNFRIRYGAAGTGVLLVDFGTLATPSGVTNRKFIVRFKGVVRTIGATGTIACHAEIIFNNGASELVTGSDVAQVTNATATIDTTAATAINLTAQWSASSPSNTTTRINQTWIKSAA